MRAALQLLGPDVEVVGACLTSGPGFEVDTGGAALLRTPAGAVAHVTFGLDDAYRSSYEICGTTGRIRLDRAFTPPADHVPVLVVEDRTGVTEIRLEPDDQVAGTVAAFARAVRGLGPVPVDPRDAVASATVLDAARLSATDGGTVRFAG